MMIWRYCSNWLNMAWEASATKYIFERRGGGQIAIWAMPIWIPIFFTHHEEGGGGPGDRGDVGGRGWEVRWKPDVTGTQIRSNLLKIVMSSEFPNLLLIFSYSKVGVLDITLYWLNVENLKTRRPWKEGGGLPQKAELAWEALLPVQLVMAIMLQMFFMWRWEPGFNQVATVVSQGCWY